MSTQPLPPNPYDALGVKKDATIPEIRSAHRKLVLKCHPDKVQDAALKAIKQDEFQKVQQAYELLSDDNRRIQYDELVKLHELRKEMGRGNPADPFVFEVRTAEPRPNSFARTKPAQPMPTKSYTQPPPGPKVYSHTAPRSYEDVIYEEPRGPAPRKTASYESTDRSRASKREDDRRRQEEDEKARQRMERERKHSAHVEKKKSRDKEKRRGSEDKYSSRNAHVDDDSDEYSYPAPRSSDKKSSRYKTEEVRYATREPPAAPLTAKWDNHKDYAAQYMQASRSKAIHAKAEEHRPKVPVDDFRPSAPRRAETFAAPPTSFAPRQVTPQFSDDESPRRSSARKESRKSAEPSSSSRREKSAKDRSRRSSPTHVSSRDAYIVSPPSPPPPARKPSLPAHSSAPAGLANMLPREKPSRSKTQEYPRKDAPVPHLPRAQTFHGERSRERTTTGGSRLKQSHVYDTEDSDSDAQPMPTQRRSHSPPPRQSQRSSPPETHTRYFIDQGRSVPVTRHRSELRDVDDERPYNHDRSPSPRGAHRGGDRPATTRTHSTRDPPRVARVIPTQQYYTPEAQEPIIREARPKMAPREGSQRTSSRSGAPFFGEVKYAANYGPEHVIYSASPADIYSGRRGDASHGRDYYPPQRSSGSREVYA